MPATAASGGSARKHSPGRRRAAQEKEPSGTSCVPEGASSLQSSAAGIASGDACGLEVQPIRSVWDDRGHVAMVSLLAVLCFVALLSMPMVLFAPTELQHPFCQAVVLVALVSAVVLVLWWQWDKRVLRGLKAAEDERETNVHQTRFSNADAEKSKRAQKAEGRILMAKFGPLVEFLKGPHQEWNSAVPDKWWKVESFSHLMGPRKRIG